MNRAWLLAPLLTVALLAACQPASEPVRIELGDAQSYAEWLKQTGQEEEPVPFAADPLDVSATGEVRAEPDVAVITALVSSEDPNESRALQGVSAQINAVQDVLSGFDAQTGFTAIGSSVERDEACLNHNAEARRRHQQIREDYAYNQSQKQRGFTNVTYRPDRPRIAQKVCNADRIRVFTRMTVRVQPASRAGNVLGALANAGAEDAQLAGYDFSDYDALYRQASERAVELARTKAETIARGAGGTLGELVAFSVDGPARVRRFGPQPRIIRPKRPPTGDGRPALAEVKARAEQARRKRLITCPDGSRAVDMNMCPRLSRSIGAYSSSPSPAFVPPRPLADSFVSDSERAITQAAATEIFTEADGVQRERVVSSGAGQARTNALTMSLMSGPQVIRATARLSFQYETPLDGVVILIDEET